MRHSIKELKNIHKNEDIYVLGSASSMDYIPKDFFNSRITIGCNYLFKHFPVTYTVAKELHQPNVEEASKVSTVILSKHPCGDLNIEAELLRKELSVPHFIFEHRQNQCTIVDWSIVGTDEIVVSWSTITSAMHIAAYMGARTIFLMGVDGGRLDGKLNFTGYNPEEEKTGEWYKNWIPQILPTTLSLRDKLYEIYGCRTMLVSPFLNFKLEGHELT